MSAIRFNQFMYTTHRKPVLLDCNFLVDSTNTNGLGISALKGQGISNVFMGTNVPLSGIAGPGAALFGSARTFGLLGATPSVTSTGATVVTGNVGIYPAASVIGFPPGTFTGSLNLGNVVAQNAQASALATYNALSVLASTVVATELGGTAPVPGVYSSAGGTFQITGGLTLTLTGTASDIWVFQTATTLITGIGAGGNANIVMAGGALASNVYFVVGSSATINSAASSAGSTFNGNVIALASITATQVGTINGSLVALTGAITLSAANAVTTQALGTPAAATAAGNPNPGPGYIYVQFTDQYFRDYIGWSGFKSPLSGTNISISGAGVLTLGRPYTITSVGTSTQANWAAMGLPAGVVPAVGLPFIATATGSGTGTGIVQTSIVSGIDSIEAIGNTSVSVNNKITGTGSYYILQTLASGVVVAPVDGSLLSLKFYLSDSSVMVAGE